MANRLTMQTLMAMLVLGLTTGAWADDPVGTEAGQPVENYAMSLEQAQQPNPAQETVALQAAAMNQRERDVSEVPSPIPYRIIRGNGVTTTQTATGSDGRPRTTYVRGGVRPAGR